MLYILGASYLIFKRFLKKPVSHFLLVLLIYLYHFSFSITVCIPHSLGLVSGAQHCGWTCQRYKVVPPAILPVVQPEALLPAFPLSGFWVGPKEDAPEDEMPQSVTRPQEFRFSHCLPPTLGNQDCTAGDFFPSTSFSLDVDVPRSHPSLILH